MSKFFVKENQIQNDKIIIDNDDVNHIKNVLRLKINDEILICDYENRINYNCKICDIDKKSVICDIISKNESVSESNIQIDIFQGIPKSDKMELIIQKGTELGVNAFYPLEMKRCIVKLKENEKEKKISRWQKIAEVASKQSGRDMLPKVYESVTIDELSKLISNYDIVIVAYECERKNTLKNELKSLKKSDLKIAVVIGPEGGIEESEIKKLKLNNAKIVTLGKRILRTETVCLAITAIINYELENLEDE